MSKMKLKCGYAEHLAVGLMTVLIDMPYDIIGVKYLHWIWHDTDPNIGNVFVTKSLERTTGQDSKFSFPNMILELSDSTYLFHYSRSPLLGSMEFLLLPCMFFGKFSIFLPRNKEMVRQT